MNDHFAYAIHYSCVLSVISCLIFASRCFLLSRTLKKEYRIEINTFDIQKLAALRASITLKEAKYLLTKLIECNMWLFMLTTIAAVLSLLSFFI